MRFRIRAALVLALLGSWVLSAAAPMRGDVQAAGIQNDVEALLARLTPAERVGQLFVVSFPGDEAVPNSAIAELIQNYHVGGVLLRSANQNLGETGTDAARLQGLIADLQTLALTPVQAVTPTPSPTPQATERSEGTATPTEEPDVTPSETPEPGVEATETLTATVEPVTASETPTATLEPGLATDTPAATPEPTGAIETPEATRGSEGSVTPQAPASPAASETSMPAPSSPRTVLPLFIMMSRDELGWIQGQSGALSGLSLMSVGATWNPDSAETLGTLEGQALQTLGVNMLLGPALDVSNPSRAGEAGDLGADTFGESAFWDGELGRAYVRGLHTGGQGRVLSVATHFPGLGPANRDVEQEVPVIQDSLENRLQTDLRPFLAAMDAAADDPNGSPDGILVTHLQYRGVTQEAQMSRPVSVDPLGLDYLFGLPETTEWRDSGGLAVSDSLGALSIKRFYDPAMSSFQAKRIASDALLAGNDILTLDDFSLAGDWEEAFANVKSTIEFFQAKYASDVAFRSRVDESVRRILLAKRGLYPRFDAQTVLPAETGFGYNRTALEQLSAIAKDAVTLVYPTAEDLLLKLPSAPTGADQIVVFEDVRKLASCDGCEQVASPEVGTAERILRALYGESGSGQINVENVQTYSFESLWRYLTDETIEDEVKVEIGAALDGADWLIFVMQGLGPDAPPQAAALRALLEDQAGTLQGKRLVAIACGAPYYLDSTDVAKLSAFYAVYDASDMAIEAGLRTLFRETSPAGILPVSVPSVGYSIPAQLQPSPAQMLYAQPESMPDIGESGTLSVGLGDELALRTGAVLDGNGHTVPDDTKVSFNFAYPESGLSWEQSGLTQDGIAETTLVLEHAGVLEVTVTSGAAERSTTLLVSIHGGQPATISTVVPTQAPTATPVPDPGTVFPSAPGGTNGEAAIVAKIDPLAFVLTVAGLLGVCALAWAWGRQRGLGFLAVELALLAFSAGMAAYLAYGLLAMALGRMPLGSASDSGFSWRWQPAIAAWLLAAAVGLLGALRPQFARRVLQPLWRGNAQAVRSEVERGEKRGEE